MFATRMNPWEDIEDVAPDEELPDYEASTAPAYDSGSFDEPFVTYHLRQYDRRIQMLVAYGTAAAAASYRITTNAFRLFSKKPEMEILYTSKEMRQRHMAVIAFDNNGPLPWCPRAHFDLTDTAGISTTYRMEAQNFAEWTVELGERNYKWGVSLSPSALELKERGSSIVIARFVYSSCGTQAARGAEVGELTIYRDGLTLEAFGIDKLVCSFVVALTHWKRMGRSYSNGCEVVRTASLGLGGDSPTSSHRASSAGFSVV